MKYDFVQRMFDVFPRRQESNFLLHASIGLGIGIAAGIGIGLLYAPVPGNETRQRLREGADRVGDKARLAVGRVRGQITTAASELRDDLREHNFLPSDLSQG
jgi:gas vesicle protein